MKNNWILLTFLSLIIFSCGKAEREEIDFDKWGDYWFQGQAEISSFELIQNRYGEER